MSKSPDEQLLETISKKIEDSKLIPEAKLSKTLKSISNGSMSADDWTFLSYPTDEELKEKADAK